MDAKIFCVRFFSLVQLFAQAGEAIFCGHEKKSAFKVIRGEKWFQLLFNGAVDSFTSSFVFFALGEFECR